MRIDFTKMHGAGNDFVVVDGRAARLPADLAAWVRRVCDRRRSVGADGVLILVPAERADFRMRYFNADGGEAEMCGNGARCIARFAAGRGVGGPELVFETLSGPIRAEVGPAAVRVHLGEARAVRPERAVAGFPGPPVVSLDTGVPHAVAFVPDVDRVPVEEWGRALRRHPEFAPAGTTADFVQVKGPRRIAVRTYERGVEAETLACGTGVTASAVAAVLARGCATPMQVEAHSGDLLTVDFRREGGRVVDMTLEGPAVTAFEGHMEWSDEQG